MSIYAFHAPQMGMRWSIDCDREELKAVFTLLTAIDSTYPNGSSFMVTSEPSDGRMRVYLSEASHERYLEAIREQDAANVEQMFQEVADEEYEVTNDVPDYLR